MGIGDLFRRKKREPEMDVLQDLVLSKLKPGYLVDYDLKTWQVTGYNTCDLGEDGMTEEWVIRNGDEVRYLDRREDDEVEWALSRKIPFDEVDPEGAIGRHIIDTEDPPEEIRYAGTRYVMEESGGGHFRRNATGEGQPFLFWEYEDETGEKYLTVEQWGEESFEASEGVPVEEYQFTHILPG